MSKIKTFGDVDTRSLEQLERCMAAGDAEFGVLCADHHPGYSQPIGGAIAYEGSATSTTRTRTEGPRERPLTFRQPVLAGHQMRSEWSTAKTPLGARM